MKGLAPIVVFRIGSHQDSENRGQGIANNLGVTVGVGSFTRLTIRARRHKVLVLRLAFTDAMFLCSSIPPSFLQNLVVSLYSSYF